MGGKFWGAGGEGGRGAVKNAQTVAGINRTDRLKEFEKRQLQGIPALDEVQQQEVAQSMKSEGFGSPFKGGVDTGINKNSALTAVPQYDTSANSAYRQQMSLRKVRANKL